MANVLVFVEQAKGQLKKISLPAITFAKEAAGKLGGECHALLMGQGIGDVANELARYGVAKVHAADAEGLANYMGESYAPVVAATAKAVGAGIVVSTATTTGKDLFPRVATLLEAGMASEVIGFDMVDGQARFKRPMYAGNAIGTVVIDTDIKVVTIRNTAYDLAAPGDGAAEVAAVAFAGGALKTTFVNFAESVSARPDLTDANVVVSLGRGIKGEENINLGEKLTDLFNGALGATRAVVDAGWMNNDLQVGQTGKIVAPDLYFAIGLSGAIQHIAGMKDSKTIVAINKDEEAPIFKVADYGLVADLFKTVPELIERIQAIKNS